MNNPMRVLAVGAGFFSHFHYEAWQRHPSAHLVGVCNRTLSGAREKAEEFDVEAAGTDLADMIDRTRPDLIDIITPPHTHLEFVRIAASRGVSVIVQKPFGENVDQARTIVDICDRAGIEVVVHENFRFMPWFREIKSWIQQERLGVLYRADFRLRPGDGQGPAAYLDRQPYFQKMERFLIHETAIHLVDTFRYLFGPVESIYADLHQCNPVIAGEDAGIVLFEFQQPVRAIFDGNRLLDHAATNPRRTMGEMLIEGTQGTLRLDGEGRLWHRNFGTTDEKPVAYDWSDKNFGGDCVYRFIDHVLTGMQGGSSLENTGREYLTNLVIEEAIYRSNNEQHRVRLS